MMSRSPPSLTCSERCNNSFVSGDYLLVNVTSAVTTSAHRSVPILAVALGVVALTLALACLLFNILLRHNRIIKMSSPRLNIVIAIGGIMGSAYCILVGSQQLTYSRSSWLCQAPPALIAVASSLMFGPMIGKTWRVNRIFKLAGAKRVVIKDYRLLTFVFILVVVDIGIWLIWTLLDPLTFASVIFFQKIQDGVGYIVASDVTSIATCTGTWSTLWVVGMVGVKVPFLLFGLREAWWTRGLILPSLNDAYCIVVSVITTISMATVYAVASVAFRKWPTVVDTCAVLAIWTSVVVSTLVVFIPKLLLWKRTPEGRPSRVSISSTSSSLAVLQSFEHLEAELNSANSEIETLKVFIKEKEVDIEKLQDLLGRAEKDLANISFVPEVTSSPDLDSIKFDQSRSPDRLGEKDVLACGHTHCCLHGNRTIDGSPCLFLPSDKGYIPDYNLEARCCPLGRKVQFFSGTNSNSAGSSSNSGIMSRYLKAGGNSGLYAAPLAPHHPPSYRRRYSLGDAYNLRGGDPGDGYDNIDDRNMFSVDGSTFWSGSCDGAIDDDDELFRYERIRRRRRHSSTPSVSSVASLSKLSKLRSNLSDAMALSETLRSSWSKDLEKAQRRQIKRSKHLHDRQRRRSTVGVREITNSIMESYDFPRNFDNHSFVSDCVTPRSSEASYEMAKQNKSLSKNNSYNNLRKLRRRNRHNHIPVAVISNAKRGNGNERFNDQEKDRGQCVLFNKADNMATSTEGDERRGPYGVRFQNTPCRFSPEDFYVPLGAGLPSTEVISNKTHNSLSSPKYRPASGRGNECLAIITNDDLYPLPPSYMQVLTENQVANISNYPQQEQRIERENLFPTKPIYSQKSFDVHTLDNHDVSHEGLCVKKQCQNSISKKPFMNTSVNECHMQRSNCHNSSDSHVVNNINNDNNNNNKRNNDDAEDSAFTNSRRLTQKRANDSSLVQRENYFKEDVDTSTRRWLPVQEDVVNTSAYRMHPFKPSHPVSRDCADEFNSTGSSNCTSNSTERHRAMVKAPSDSQLELRYLRTESPSQVNRLGFESVSRSRQLGRTSPKYNMEAALPRDVTEGQKRAEERVQADGIGAWKNERNIKISDPAIENSVHNRVSQNWEETDYEFSSAERDRYRNNELSSDQKVAPNSRTFRFLDAHEQSSVRTSGYHRSNPQILLKTRDQSVPKTDDYNGDDSFV